MFALKHKITEVWSRKSIWAPTLSFPQTATRTRSPDPIIQWQHDSKRLRSDSAVKKPGRFRFKDLELACTLRGFVYSFLRRSWLHRLAMPEHKARKPDAPKSVKKQGFCICGKVLHASCTLSFSTDKTISIQRASDHDHCVLNCFVHGIRSLSLLIGYSCVYCYSFC